MIHTRAPLFVKPSAGTDQSHEQHEAVVIGGGPAGLMAAEQLASSGLRVHLFDSMPSVGRKFLLAGKGGLNLTHSEADDCFRARFGERSVEVATWLDAFGAADMRVWAAQLGVDTFVGSSGRVFPVGMKAAPLLRAWLARLRAAGVVFRMRHRWCGWTESGELRFEHLNGLCTVNAAATVLALGGASWPQLGSDAAWVAYLERVGVQVQPLGPANCGFDVMGGPGASGWSAHFASRFAGVPLKSVAVVFQDTRGEWVHRRGEFVVTQSGVEGSLIYAVSSPLRDAIAQQGCTTLQVDLLPDHSDERVLAAVMHPRGSRSLSSHLKSRLGIAGVKMALLHEMLTREQLNDPQALARAIKRLALPLRAPRPVAEAISTHGGVALEVLDAHLMLQARPSVFCCGEMLDWEAPTGGYLLTASMASGLVAGRGAAAWLKAEASR